MSKPSSGDERTIKLSDNQCDLLIKPRDVFVCNKFCTALKHQCSFAFSSGQQLVLMLRNSQKIVCFMKFNNSFS